MELEIWLGIWKFVLGKTPNVGQMLLSRSQGGMSVISFKFDPKKFRELIVVSIIKHDLPFRYVEYESVRKLM